MCREHVYAHGIDCMAAGFVPNMLSLIALTPGCLRDRVFVGSENAGVEPMETLNWAHAPCWLFRMSRRCDGWRRERDSNPRYGYKPYTRFPGVRLQPLGHLSGATEFLAQLRVSNHGPRRTLGASKGAAA